MHRNSSMPETLYLLHKSQFLHLGASVSTVIQYQHSLLQTNRLQQSRDTPDIVETSLFP